jgi:DNA-binding MurR/RpiR family transcriptional regulator
LTAGGILTRLREIAPELTSAEARVANFITAHADEVAAMSITVLAQRSEASEATVVRLCRKLHLRGYQELRLALAQDAGDPRLRVLHEDVRLGDDTSAVLGKVFAAANAALQDTLGVVDAAQFEKAVTALAQAETINLFGTGASGAVCQDAYYRFMKLGTFCYALTEASAQLARVATIGPRDVVVAVSHSGRSRDLVYSVRQAHERGAVTIGITQFGRQPLVAACDLTLFTSSRETAFRSEAMASRIAQLTLLDSLFIGVALTRYEATTANLEAARELTAHLRT